MPCDLMTINSDITLDCSDVPVGGLVKVLIARYNNVSAFTEVDGEITDITLAADTIVDLEFNPKDGYSNFTDVKSVDDSGVVSAIPNVMLEFPKMTVEKRNAIELLTASGSELALFIETAAGIRHAVGLDFGAWGSEANGQSGTGRSEKNTYTIKFEGEETNLSRLIDDAAWTQILTAKKA